MSEIELEDLNSNTKRTSFITDVEEVINADPSFSIDAQSGIANSFLDPRENAPGTYLYRKPYKRPTIAELRQRQKEANIKPAPPVEKERKYGTFYAVFIPLIINIVGAIYWNRIGQAIGDIGLIYSLILFVIGLLLSLTTAFSMSALATNGEMEDGGTYFLISRTAGPNMGRAIGILLTIANTINGGVALLALAENITTMYSQKYFTGSLTNDLRVIAAICVPFAFFCSRFVQYVRVVSAIFLALGIAFFIIGVFTNDYFSIANLKINLYFEDVKKKDVIKYFSFFTSAFNSLLSAYNFTGQLKRPEKMIPKGIFWAEAVAFLVYSLTAFFIAGSSQRISLQTHLLSPLTSLSLIPYFGYAPITLITIQRSLGSFGAPPLMLTRMENDNLIPQINNKLKTLVPLVLACVVVAVGSLDTLATISSVLYLNIYAVLHQAVYQASTSHIPGWRPSFKLHRPLVSLLGMILCFVLGFIMNWIVAISTWILVIIVELVSNRFQQTQNWGTVHQSRAYYSALKSALRLRKVSPNPKLFRVNLLVIVSANSSFDERLMPFVKRVLQQEGFCIVSQVLDEGVPLRNAIEFRKSYEMEFASKGLFFDTVLAPDDHTALEKLLLSAGVGNIRPNTVCIDLEGREPLVVYEMITTALKRSVGILLVDKPNLINEQQGSIDVWYLSDDGGLILLIPYMAANRTKIRVFTIAQKDTGETADEAMERTMKLIEQFRINAEVIVLELSEREDRPSQMALEYWDEVNGSSPEEGIVKRVLLLADLVRENSSGACLVCIPLILPKKEITEATYYDLLMTLANIDTTVAFIHGNGTNVLSWEI